MRFIANVLERMGLLEVHDDEAAPELAPEDMSTEAILARTAAALEAVKSPEPVEEPSEAEDAPSDEASQEAQADEEPEASQSTTRRIKLSDLVADRLHPNAKENEQALAHQLDFELDFDDIFDAAGVKLLKHGWTVDKAADWLDTVEERGLGGENVIRRLQLVLRQTGADLEDVAIDAVAKDEALDVYEVELVSRVESTVVEHLHEEERIVDEIRRLTDRAARLEEERERLVEQLDAWRQAKHEREARWEAVIEAIGPHLQRS